MTLISEVLAYYVSPKSPQMVLSELPSADRKKLSFLNGEGHLVKCSCDLETVLGLAVSQAYARECVWAPHNKKKHGESGGLPANEEGVNITTD